MATRRSWIGWGLVIAASAALVACAGRDITSDMGMPDAPVWVNEGTRALSSPEERLFHGVGSAPPMDDSSLQRATADTRARADLAAVLGTYMDAVVSDYSSTSASAGSAAGDQAVRREIEAVTRINLAGSRIIARWKDPDSGTVYSLAELNMDHIQSTVTAVEDMDAGLRGHIRERGANIFDRISEQGEAPQ